MELTCHCSVWIKWTISAFSQYKAYHNFIMINKMYLLCIFCSTIATVLILVPSFSERHYYFFCSLVRIKTRYSFCVWSLFFFYHCGVAYVVWYAHMYVGCSDSPFVKWLVCGSEYETRHWGYICRIKLKLTVIFSVTSLQ